MIMKKKEVIEDKSRELLLKAKTEENNKIVKQRKQLEERQRELQEQEEQLEDPESMLSYIQQRLKSKTLTEALAEMKKQVKEAKKNLAKVNEEIARRDLRHPDYPDRWQQELKDFNFDVIRDLSMTSKEKENDFFITLDITLQEWDISVELR